MVMARIQLCDVCHGYHANQWVGSLQLTPRKDRAMTNDIQCLTDQVLDQVTGGGRHGGAEVCMIYLQSLVSQRELAQMVTNLITALGDTAKSVASNIGH